MHALFLAFALALNACPFPSDEPAWPADETLWSTTQPILFLSEIRTYFVLKRVSEIHADLAAIL